VIADIGGYTQFMRLHRLSLAHSEEITGRLLEAAIEAAPELELVDIEGDAAFFCAFESDERPGPMVADTSVAMHRAFHEKQQEIAANTLCPCEECAQVGSLSELAELPSAQQPSVGGRVRETATVLGRGMPYLLGIKKRATREARDAGSA